LCILNIRITEPHPSDDDPSGATLSVADTGPGIPPEDRERVFDRFYRGADSDTSGSGLGLSIVKRIADAHHAAITLDAPPQGSGLIVRVRFPKQA
jgi:signal transduction histidine kinase